MFIPYNTDAPIYHFPSATIGLIVTNCLVFFASLNADASYVEPFILQFNTINPVQWLTCNFLHADIFHLLGNMFFLWGFGLVVEGKLGWLKFLSVYLFIGITQGIIVQLSMFLLGGTTGALGASSAIFGLMALAVVWAPRNDMNCLMIMGWFTRPVDMPILGFGGLYFALQLVPMFFFGFHMSSQMLHLVGLAVGFPIGVLMLKNKSVDCEGWDLFNVMKGQETKLISQQRAEARAVANGTPLPVVEKSNQKTKKRKKIDEANFEPVDIDQGTVVAQSINDALKANNVDVAMALYRKQTRVDPEWRAPNQVIANLINGLHSAKRWQESVPFMVEIIQRLPDKTASTRIKLAQIMLQIENRPRQSMRLLSKLPANISDEKRRKAQAVYNAASQASEAGEVELFVEDW